MGIITRMLKQQAVYWPVTGFDRNGNPTHGPPEVIKCRWEDKNELFIDMKGKEVVSKAIVYVEKDVDVFGYLKLGSSYTSSTPLENTKVNLIRGFSKLPNIRNTEQLRTAML